MNIWEEVVPVFVGIALHGSQFQTFCGCPVCKERFTKQLLQDLPPLYARDERERDRLFELVKEERRLEILNHLILKTIYKEGSSFQECPDRHT
ncbi:hypothetical protein [Salsuginibacillus kocurii]|uniref:hypothetical protein n=1 Tax=Salsuginibacillus kocurii TaxID=427078 RepID=UPI000364E070|nr:hypothetical protein [Salsuginibacillus kocurii]